MEKVQSKLKGSNLKITVAHVEERKAATVLMNEQVTEASTLHAEEKAAVDF